MSHFEYLTVAVSIVLSLGLVRLVHGLRFAGNRAGRYWPHLGYLGVLVVSHLFFWWLLWGFQAGVTWNFGRFAWLFVGPMLLYSMASTMVPDNPSTVVSWREHFYQAHRSFFLVMAGFTLYQALSPLLIRGVPPLPRSWPGVVAGIVLPIAGAYSRSERVHSVLFLAIAAAFLVLVVTVAFESPIPPGR